MPPAAAAVLFSEEDAELEMVKAAFVQAMAIKKARTKQQQAALVKVGCRVIIVYSIAVTGRHSQCLTTKNSLSSVSQSACSNR